MPHRSRKVDHGSHTDSDDATLTHYWVTVGDATVWRRVVRTGDTQYSKDQVGT